MNVNVLELNIQYLPIHLFQLGFIVYKPFLMHFWYHCDYSATSSNAEFNLADQNVYLLSAEHVVSLSHTHTNTNTPKTSHKKVITGYGPDLSFFLHWRPKSKKYM